MKKYKDQIVMEKDKVTVVSIIGDRGDRTGMECKNCNRDYHQCGSCNMVV